MDGVVALELFPDWVTRPLREHWAGQRYQPIPASRRCTWCGDYLPFFGPKVCRLGGHDLHAECNDKAVRFALKASIRNRTNPTTGYFSGWRTP